MRYSDSINKELVITDANIQYYLRVESDGHISLRKLMLDQRYDKIHIMCLYPPKIDGFVPYQQINGMEMVVDGEFIMNGHLQNNMEVLFWRGKWWTKNTI